MSDFNFACDKCPRTFKLEEFYEKHKKVHELKKQHKCVVCGFVYGAAKGLEGHLKSHSEDELAKAKEEKDNASQSPISVDFHFLNPQGVLTSQNNKENGKSDAQLQALNQAKALSELSVTMSKKSDPPSPGSPTNKSPSPAGTGNYEIYDSVPEVTDASTAMQNDSGFFMCDICKREFSGLNSLKKHVPIHTRRVQHKCDVCGFVFGKKEYLMDHMRKHTGEVSPICEVCSQTFNKSLKLKEHFKLHRNTNNDGSTNEKMPYRCHVCKEAFKIAKVLGNHLNTAHAETVYRCDICEASFGDVRGKNHHMYNEHQLDAFHQKCVWCPVCNQGFTRHYNLKVHMYKSHGKDYIENNFSAEELAALTKPPTGTSAYGTARASPTKSDAPGPASKKGIPNLPPGTSILKTNLEKGSPRPKHLFDQKKGTQLIFCQICNERFLRKSDLYIHQESKHDFMLINCELCDDKFTDASQLREHSEEVHGERGSFDEPPALLIKTPVRRRRPGPASKTNAPMENRVMASNIPAHLQFDEQKNGYECKECGKVLQHRQSFVSHMRVIHGNYYGGNNWKGSQVVDMILDGQAKSPKKKSSNVEHLAAAVRNLEKSSVTAADGSEVFCCDFCDKVFTNQTGLREHVVHNHIGPAQQQHCYCELCGKSFKTPDHLEAHQKAKHPNLNKRLQSLRDALGLDTDEPASKRARLSSGTSFTDESLPSESVLSSSSISSDTVDVHLHVASSSSSSSPRKKTSECPVCGVVLSPKTNVNVHMRTHSGARPYQCVLCLNRFRQKAHLMKHFRCSHNQKQPPFLCMFCKEENESSNDLYRHIADRHKAETDAMHGDEKPDEELEEYKEDEMVIADQEPMTVEEDDVRYEPITEAFLFEGGIIHPCYVILPYVTDKEVEASCGQSIQEIYGITDEMEEEPEHFTIDEESGPLTIDESYVDDEVETTVEKESPMLGNLLKESNKTFHGLSGSPKPTNTNNGNYNAEDIKYDNSLGYYPALGDFSLPFSLSNLYKKKADSTPGFVPPPQMTSPPRSPSKDLKKVKSITAQKQTSRKSDTANNNSTAITDYEAQIQQDDWPLECIKCDAVVGSLGNFNDHMNDHWTEDKCCPVCGLLINSKRFNFKQHLKIHTGEKPFACQICNRSFRQKAHMVKHVTTHRTVPQDVQQAALAVK